VSEHQWIAIFDYGSQYNQLIARRVRELSVYCEILPHTTSAAELAERKPTAIIFSGGPASVYGDESPTCDPAIFDLDIPFLGICYGMQLACEQLGCDVASADHREFGRTTLTVQDHEPLFHELSDEMVVWMSHGDRVDGVTEQFEVLAVTDSCPYAAVKHKERPIYGVQFHPEVHHTPMGTDILRNFLFRVAGCTGDWNMHDYVDTLVAQIKDQVGDGGVICGLSGGVDSSVAAALIHRAIGDRLACIFVDNGLLRKDEAHQVRATFEDQLHLNFTLVDAREQFLSALAGVTDPEKKRKIIGGIFVDVFKEEAKRFENYSFLAQGTLYPDVIESESAFGGPTAVIKTHHNVGGLPEQLGFDLVEPLRYLFKDEVREIGRALGLPAAMVERQPFPGPGLAVRILGDITEEKIQVLQDADAIVREELESSGASRTIWQYFGVLLPVQTVGVMGDERTYENVLAVRAVESVDGMTADWARVPHEVLAVISNRVINEVRGINRVVYDISSKPPATIEWE
jgi:GMP synthase (glutamine-hydrolysing)